jgi:hypothetical protein
MIGTLYRQDYSLNSLAAAPLGAAFIGLTIVLIERVPHDYLRVPMRELHPMFSFMFTILWFVIVLVLFATHIYQRSGRLLMTLPVPARKAWIAHNLGILTGELLFVVLLALIVAVRFPGGSRITFAPGTILLGIHLAGGMVLMTVLLQLPSPSTFRIGISPGYVVYVLFVAFIVLLVLLIGLRWPFTPLVLSALAALIGFWHYRNLPEGFLLQSTHPEPDGVPPAEQARGAPEVHRGTQPGGAEEHDVGARTSRIAGVERSGREIPVAEPAAGIDGRPRTDGGFRRFFNLVCLRTFANRWHIWLYSLILFLYTVLIVIAYHGGVERDNPYPFFLYIWIFPLIGQTLVVMHKLDFLPIPRRTLFMYVMLPVIGSMALGFGVGQIAAMSQRRNMRQINFCCHTIVVPEESWELRKGEPPPVISPWGETHAPEAYPLYRGSDTYIYNPYDCGKDSSARFAALQLERAARAVFGISFNPLEADDGTTQVFGISFNPLEADDGTTQESFLGAVDEGRGTPSELIALSSERRNRTFATGAILFALLYTIVIYLLLRGTRERTPRSKLIYVGPAGVIIFVLVVALVVAGDRAGYTNARAVSRVIPILVRRLSEQLPVHAPALWAIFGAVCIGCYLVLQRAFAAVEVVSKKPQKFISEH